MRIANISTCNLNQWALDFQGNYERIVESILKAKELGSKLRLGPELEISGYGCEDHFLENDTFEHSWEILCKIIDSDLSDGIFLDIGMPVLFKSVPYNCRVLICNREILLIRPKLFLANDGNYRETRWFSNWKKLKETEVYYLPEEVTKINKQKTCPIGDAVIIFNDTSYSVESCEELFTPKSPNIQLYLDGIEIIGIIKF
jgi:NAD+ synthase (glutamine-hydrolysing)